MKEVSIPTRNDDLICDITTRRRFFGRVDWGLGAEKGRCLQPLFKEGSQGNGRLMALFTPERNMFGLITNETCFTMKSVHVMRTGIPGCLMQRGTT